jgi:GGDEF domain-containing protein
LTLLLVELDGVPELTAAFGTEGLGKLRRFVERACRSVDHPGAICLDDGDHGFAVVLPDCERHAAVRLANHLIDQIRQVNPAQSSPGRPTLSVSAGAAALSVPPKNFHPQDLLEAARRCLYASHASGGSVVKSIDVF